MADQRRNMEGKNYSSLIDASRYYEQQGFTDRYQMEESGLKNLESGSLYQPADMEIIAMHRFEGPSNPDDMSIFFAVKTSDGRKGTINSAYGMYADANLLDFMDEVEKSSKADSGAEQGLGTDGNQ